MHKILVVFGTRPEAIKMAPVIKQLQAKGDKVDVVVCVTAQHRKMLDQVLSLFNIQPNIDLDLMEENQSLSSLSSRAITEISVVLERNKPDMVLIQGDTTTAMIAGLASFYQKIPVGHVEAGLRTKNRYSPFPEEINRQVISVLTTYHFAPTQTAVDALLAEGVLKESIFLTGNTVVDALMATIKKIEADVSRKRIINASFPFLNIEPNPDGKTLILVTAHRRENFGKPLENICLALHKIATRNNDVEIVYPVHLNPNVQEPVYRILSKHVRIHLIEPMEYMKFCYLIDRSYVVLTDSGGIQEEAPALGKPVLVMRRETERPEAVEAGTVKVVGTEIEDIVSQTQLLLHDKEEYNRMAQAVSPYGDGHAAERIVEILLRGL